MKRALATAMATALLSGAMGSAVFAAEPSLEINACELLTPAEITAAIGLPVDQGRRQDEGMSRDGQYSSTCFWTIEPGKAPDQTAPGRGRRFVILNAQRWPAGRDMAKKFLQAFHESADQGVIANQPVPRKFGDEALWWGDGLAVRKGDVSFGLSVFMPKRGEARTSALEEKLAPQILKRLDRKTAV
ncbi:hypothetical protein GCM10011487_56080 [Steroidobacter agaridevorans]|uniref:DUF3558 domain-containing protein n=1 Tax=Steroidobacter agaridevorans TaxID=2695856 RepID=A0A829YLK9_9GAMM|nr:hypothetical protein [Steroidobacter agaridevorans]GFE83608.1 hypothetical protein GCM10011487_56080 [Steroidobacter agaridevorans]